MMNNLSNKYGIPAEKIQKMIRDGIINCTWVGWEEVYDYYKSVLSTSGSKSEAINITSVKKNVSERTVYTIIHRIES